MDYLISCDWFQYCCENPSGFQPKPQQRLLSEGHAPSGERIVYDVIVAKEFHPIYKDSITLAYKQQPIVHVHYNPNSNAIPSHYVAVKVDNRVLYSGDWSYWLHDAIRTLRLVINNITRLDLCLDFQMFDDGMLPYDFMRTYLADSVKGEQTYIRKHSNQFTIVANKTIKSQFHPNGTQYAADIHSIEIHGKQTEVGFKEGEELFECTPFFQTIRWGSRQSAVMVELYNKSKELHDKRHKPYISQCWQEVGLIQSPDLPVYRLEISITSKGLGYQSLTSVKTEISPDKTTFSKLTAANVDTQAKLEDVFWAYAAEYFTFYKFRSSCKWKKDMPIVQLFPRECIEMPVLKPRTINRSHDTGRSERLAASTFERLSHQLIDIPDSDRSAFRKVAQNLAVIGALKSARHIAQTKEEQAKIQKQAYEEYCDNLQAERLVATELEEGEQYLKDIDNGSYKELIRAAEQAFRVTVPISSPKWWKIKGALDILKAEFGFEPTNYPPQVADIQTNTDNYNHNFDCSLIDANRVDMQILNEHSTDLSECQNDPFNSDWLTFCDRQEPPI